MRGGEERENLWICAQVSIKREHRSRYVYTYRVAQQHNNIFMHKCFQRNLRLRQTHVERRRGENDEGKIA